MTNTDKTQSIGKLVDAIVENDVVEARKRLAEQLDDKISNLIEDNFLEYLNDRFGAIPVEEGVVWDQVKKSAKTGAKRGALVGTGAGATAGAGAGSVASIFRQGQTVTGSIPKDTAAGAAVGGAAGAGAGGAIGGALGAVGGLYKGLRKRSQLKKAESQKSEVHESAEQQACKDIKNPVKNDTVKPDVEFVPFKLSELRSKVRAATTPKGVNSK